MSHPIKHWMKSAVLAMMSFSLIGFFVTEKLPDRALAEEKGGDHPFLKRNAFLENPQFIQIPGPNPILVRGGAGAWDEGTSMETADAFNDLGVYYLYYHAMGKDKKRWPGYYRLGVATATHPLGPWKKFEGNPVLNQGPPGSWDESAVASAAIVKVSTNKYYMFYGGAGEERKQTKPVLFGGEQISTTPVTELGDQVSASSIGLATASSPLGPWKKYERNPILRNFGWTGGVVNANGKWYLYTMHPVNLTGDDYAPISVAVADRPEGPWKEWPFNPVLSVDGWGNWDDGGFSEGEVVYWNGVFHLFYGGAKLFPNRAQTRESIGYAYSFDGYNFAKYGRNPVATPEAVPNAGSFSEVHTVFEPPFIYLYHTLRYKTAPPGDEKDFPDVEDIGMTVLATQTPFRIDMPALSVESLGPGQTTSLERCTVLSVSNVGLLAVTTESTFHTAVQKGTRLHVRSSYDGLGYDSVDLYTYDIEARPGKTVRKTVEFSPKVKFIKLLIENLDDAQRVSNLKVNVTLGRN
jgi:hypothetical protein